MNPHEQLTFLGIRPPVERRNLVSPETAPRSDEERRKLPNTYLEERLIALVENLHAKHIPPFQEAHMFWELTQSPYGFTSSRLAKVVGKDPMHVAQSLQLMEWPEGLRDTLAAMNFSAEHLFQLKRLSIANEVTRLAAQADQAHWSPEELRQRIDDLLGLHDQALVEAERKKMSALLLDPLAYELHQGDLDPLSPIWSRLAQDPQLQHLVTWAFQYRGHLKWTFDVKAGTSDPAAARLKLAEWFRKMADALEGNR